MRGFLRTATLDRKDQAVVDPGRAVDAGEACCGRTLAAVPAGEAILRMVIGLAPRAARSFRTTAGGWNRAGPGAPFRFIWARHGERRGSCGLE